MGVLEKFLDVMNLKDDDYEDDYYDDEFDEDEDFVSAKQKGVKEKAPKGDKGVKTNSKITPIRQGRKSNEMDVRVLRPSNVEDAREITETLLSNRIVVLNLEGLDVDIAQRVIDFSSGSCYALNGNLQKVSSFIFIITPSSVDISGDIQEMLTSAAYDIASM